MGHTVSSQRQVADAILQELEAYARALRQEDLPAFRSLLAKAKRHFGTISYVSSYNTWAFVLISMLLEQEKEILEMGKKK
jgi:hypothetical protein